MARTARTRLLLVVFLLSGTAAAGLLHGGWGRWLALGALVLQAAAAVYLTLRQPDPVEIPDPAVLDHVGSFDTTLRIGDETMPLLKQGLNEESAQKVTEIIHKITEVDAVAITDNEKILGFTGVGCRRHRQGGPILTGATRDVLQTGDLKIVTDHSILSCDEPGCPHPLHSAVIAPLKFRGSVVGTFKLYRTSSQPMPSHIVRMAAGISALLGIQMELAEAERHRQLATRARLEALQAQIRPHFLFNVLNTIIMFSRTDVERSRELLVSLSQFFRRSLSYRGNFITLGDEVEYLSTYLSLEKARFGEKLAVRMKVDPHALGVQIPILTLQPLVENAVVHGLAPAEEGGVVGIRVHRVRDEIHVFICDNGVGMDRERLRRVFEEGFGQNMGLGLTNVNDRLVSLYGESHRLHVKSRPGRGTAIRVRIPVRQPQAAAQTAASAD
jgi:LytS/YehU family sensor histidine kinase